ncbi:ABC transporter ATP-binding protein [Pedobacter sp. MC2016-14]|uniref:ABC transporter ATP-binding protein n=1 Tax=Pedobacter sp. MC2016-14 TaxID=2897327 RepID=UPI001E2FAF27|nr:ABC transporter ATP-binding protein [Pedobacter sp. MC2016-14]MCD0488660.1 ABC transporter ATP-binding protein [Pedobacter sp. MC2016-14]
MIHLKAVAHSYADAHPIDFKDWEINSGEKWLLLGASGSGKTTLLHILSGLLRPKKGEVIVDGTSLYTLEPKALDHFRGQKIGIVFQQPHLIKSLTIAENLLLAQSFAKLPEDQQRITEVLESLDMVQKRNAYPSQLSQGQLQRISIARAVINKPALLIADEPTSSLDDKNATAVLNLLLKQSELNTTTLLVATHDQRVKDTFTNRYELT